MKSSTNRALVAKKQSTSFAQVANNLLNLLQGYTKGIRFTAILTLLFTIGVGQVWAEDATLSFASTAQRVSQNTTKQVWSNDGITFTNNKASSNTNVANYSKPVRLYAGSNVIVEHTSKKITKIVFDCNTTAYATEMKNSIGTVSGATVTVSSNKVTVTFNEVVESFTVAKLTAQVRLDAITVTYGETCTNPNITTQPTGATYTKGATATALKVVASGTNLTYQWYSNTSDSESGATKINDATNSTYEPSTSTAGTKYYYCIVSSGSCSTTSNIVSVVVKNPPFTVTLNAGPGTCAAYVTETSAGKGVTLPTPTLNGCGEWRFAGWKETSAVSTETTTAPTLLSAGSIYKPTNNCTLYAVYQRTEESAGGGSSEEDVVFSAQGYTNQQEVLSYDGTNFSVEFNKGSNSNTPKYYTSGSAIRIYGGGYFTISSESTITEIVITFGTSDGSNAISASTGTYESGTWTGSEKSVKFTIGGSSGNRRIASLTVTTSGGSSSTYYHSTPDCGSSTYTVTFNANGHGTTPQEQTITSGGKASEPTAPTATGYTFGGWYKEEGCTNAWNFATDVVTKDTTLYAKWTAIQTTITLSANGGSGNTTNVAATYDSSTLNPSSITNPTKTGYTFGGWYSDEGGTGSQVINSSGKLQANVSGYTGANGVWKATTNKTLYAKWTPSVYTITYKDQGNATFSGTHESGNPTQHTYGTETTLKGATKTGYTFGGWYKEATCTDKVTSLGATEYTANITLYAQWTANTYTVKFDGNGSDGGSMTNQLFTYGQSQALSANAFTRTNYAFKNWNTKSDGTGTNYTNQQSVSNLTSTNNGTVTLYAQWTKLHTITWSAAGETSTTTVVDGDAVVLPSAPTSSCSDTYTTFVGWYTAASGMETSPSATPQGQQVTASTIPTGNATYHAVWADAGAAADVVDVINNAFTINKTQTNYATWSNTGTSGTSYTGNSAGSNGTVQLRSSDSNSGIVTTTSGGKATKVVVSWNSGTTDGRTLNVYGKNSAYSAATDLYSTSTQGTKLGSIVKGTSTELTIEGDYEYIGLRSNSGAMYLDEIQIIWSAGSDPTGYISSCCQSLAVVTVTPANANLELNIDGTASTTVNISQSNGGNGKYYEPTVSPADGASLDWAALKVDYKQTAYGIKFTATKAGTYTVTGNFTETEAGCPKYGSATINVVANPILLASASELTFSPTCGQNSTSQEVEINSRYLTSNSITATVATTSGSGKFTISKDNTTFGTSNLTLSGGIATKVSDQIYMRYEAEEGETGAVAGTLTLKCGSTQKVINLTGTCTCSANVTITGDPIQITAAKGVWVEAATELIVTGTFLTTNADNANVSIRAYTNNAAFQIKKGGVTGEGAPKTAYNNALTLNTDGAISTADWTGNIGIVYKPTQANTTETATLTIEVYRHNGSAIYSTATYELEGRSLPEQFVIAVTNGSGDWFAVPADMVAPWGNACSGLGTFAPYPISVDNTTAPTIASDVPARAVYQAAARTGNVNTNPQTMSYKSVPLGGNYYLYGSSTSVDSDGSNTHIQNASFAASEKQKWFLDVVDWNTKRYNMHLHGDLTTNVLAYTTAGGANRVGQYSAIAGTTKKSIYLLPINGTTCTYYAAPVVEVMAIDATNATIQFKNDRTTAYEISLDQNTWTDLAVTLIKDCNNSEEATLLQAQLPLATYRGKTVYIRAKVTTGTACQETGSFVVPNPTIDRGETPWKFTGTAGQAFSNNSKSITISDLWNPLSVSVVQQTTNSNIQASITPEGVVTVSMAAADAKEGVHQAVLQFISDGASFVDNGKGNPQYVGVQITLHSLATQEFDGGSYAFTITTPKVLCENLVDENTPGWKPEIYLSYPLYKDGDAISSTSDLNETEFTLIDINTGSELSFSREGSDGGIAKITLNETSRSSMIPGHTYRLSWENTNQVMTNVDGLPYMDCYMDFIYSENCDAPTALAACPITNSSFTANWIGDATKLNVYTKAETEALNQDITNASLNLWKSYSNDYTAKWLYSVKGDMKYNLHTTYGFQVSSTGSSWAYLYTPQIGKMLAGVTANTEIEVTIEAYCTTTANKVKCFVIDGEPTNNTFPQSGNMVTINGGSANSWTSEQLSIPAYTEVSFRVSGLTSTSRIAITALNASKTTYIKTVKISSVASQSIGIYSVTGDTYNVTGLSANTTYYYTVTDGSSNTSNEIAVTTYNGEPSLKYYSDEACTTSITETTVLGGEETTVYVKGTEVPGCAINASVSAGYGMDDSGINYITGTGVVSGSIKLTLADANTTEGTLTITDAEGNEYVLNIVSSDCPAGFATMALPATNITPNTAQANWTTTLDFGDDKNGTLHLYKNGIVYRELIVNGDFETGSLADGWSNGINKGEVGGAHSFDQYTIKNSSVEAHDGNYSLYITADGSELTNFQGQSVMYADYITLTPGTYSMSARVKMPMADGRDDKTQYFSLGIITEKNGDEHVYTVSTPVTVYSNNTYVQLTHEFEVTSTITACPAIGASSGTFRYFYLDDVSLMCTSIGQGEEPYLSIDIADLSADGNIALTGLNGNTEYTYIIQNADGCSSNAITFQTTDANAPQLSVTTPVSIAAPLGGSAKGVATVTATDAYSTINVTLADNEQRIRLNATTIPAAGGVVQFTFTPLGSDYPGTTGISIVTLTTQGMVNPVELTINWAVTSGIDVNTPMVDVTEISNEQITIEHNVDLENELNVRIIMNRPITDDEIEENVGDEIFFSKYYEAYMHKKLWAIFNPTAQKRSLAGMQVWRSKSSYEDWNTAPENIIDLSEMGNYEKGWIYPNEEIIVYTADQVGECERSKTDMSNWVAMSSSNLPVSFSGDDALLLVRKVSAVEQAKNNTPPTTSTNGDPISWRTYTDSESQEWYMLDLIGARTEQNKPDGSATRSWSWTDCSTTPAKIEVGDAAGWVGYGYDLADNKTKYASCEGEGYILSTNRCLLIRRMNVKSGANAVATNIGDMVTLNSEWKGSHVPKDGDQEQTSCENFSYVGGYDYDGYYNAWVPMTDEEFTYATKNPDGTYTFDMDVPHYYCDTMRIEVVEKVTVNGVESDNIHAYNLYKVPIVVDVDANTNDEKFFHYPERPSDALSTPIENEKILTDDICTECDVVIRDAARLTHINGGQGQFRNIMVYPGAKLNNTNGQAFELQGLHIQALNDTVGYAIINNNQSSIVVDTIIHTKRINDQYWYIFSLPYDCNVAAIRQLNGKSMGDYGTDWGIQYYDGRARQETGTSAAPGAVSKFWKRVEPNATLKANEAYIIGLFTTQWKNQHKTIYFPPTESTKYTESGDESKETNVYNWNVNLSAEKHHHGWNFVGSPYISIFDPNGQTDAGVNNGSVVIKGEIQPDGSYTNDTEVFVSIPDGSNARTYTQQRAAATKLEPFKGYFIQVVDPTSGEDETKTLQYSKTGRTLHNDAPARKAQAAREKVVVELELVAFDNQVDYAGILVDDNYKPEYEISGDLVKMYAAASKPQLYLRDMTNEQMAYIALPDAQAENIPLEFYAPKIGNYTLALNQQKSRIHGAKTIELLYNGEVVANLMFDTYTIAAQKGVNKGYSIRIQRVAQVITSIDNVSMEGITIATTEGYITIEGLPTGAQVMLYDMVGKLIKADYEMNGIVNFDAPTQGVYEISIQTAQGNNCVKTIIR